MDDDAILALIRRALVDVAPDRADDFATIDLSTDVASLELDSISVMEMIGVVEDELETTFPDDKLPGVATFADLAVLIRAAAG